MPRTPGVHVCMTSRVIPRSDRRAGPLSDLHATLCRRHVLVDRSQAQKDEKGAPMVRIKDVAEHAGVSTVTVSRVINEKSVRPRFREAVERW